VPCALHPLPPAPLSHAASARSSGLSRSRPLYAHPLNLSECQKKYIAFRGSGFTTAVEHETLARTASLRRLFIDVAAYVDAAGLHVRYRGGRGGYNWKPRLVVPADSTRVLAVELRPPVRAAVPRPGGWLGELLQEMGYAV
jgi:hypothetical protein